MQDSTDMFSFLATISGEMPQFKWCEATDKGPSATFEQ